MCEFVTNEAPNFKATAVMADNSFKEISLSDYRGKYVLLFFYPLDFTFVCPSEILAFDRAVDEFQKRNCEVIGVSVDSHFTHLAWKETPVEKGGIGSVRFPLVADLSKSISRDYGVLLESGIALRGLFLIDKDGIIRHMLVNDLPLGRSVDEALRVLDALQFVEKHGEVCPANWKPGEEAMKPTKEGVAEYLAKHAKPAASCCSTGGGSCCCS
ncbi:MAG: peroxiredoxin [Deltaproteobacteria bacterium]|jgi:peroxiredoxin (alkyl hydroperoxide reductase subunit C)|nr:peroxiredoxin [Deltaproteobacteria bacterium]